jgi:hypothetical protein
MREPGRGAAKGELAVSARPGMPARAQASALVRAAPATRHHTGAWGAGLFSASACSPKGMIFEFVPRAPKRCSAVVASARIRSGPGVRVRKPFGVGAGLIQYPGEMAGAASQLQPRGPAQERLASTPKELRPFCLAAGYVFTLCIRACASATVVSPRRLTCNTGGFIFRTPKRYGGRPGSLAHCGPALLVMAGRLFLG